MTIVHSLSHIYYIFLLKKNIIATLGGKNRIHGIPSNLLIRFLKAHNLFKLMDVSFDVGVWGYGCLGSHKLICA